MDIELYRQLDRKGRKEAKVEQQIYGVGGLQAAVLSRVLTRLRGS